MRDMLLKSTDMWTSYVCTLQGGMEPMRFCACARASVPFLKVLGRITRPLRKSMIEDISVIETACASAPGPEPYTTLSALSPEHAPNLRVVSAIMWCARGLTFACTVARAMSESRVATTTHIVRAAYEELLAPYHSKSMAVLFKQATELMPKRDKVRARVAGSDVDELLGAWADVVDPALLHLSIMCRERDWVLHASDRHGDSDMLETGDGDDVPSD